MQPALSQQGNKENLHEKIHCACAAGAGWRLVAALKQLVPLFHGDQADSGKVSAAELIGQPTILIVTPSKDAPGQPATAAAPGILAVLATACPAA